MPYMKFEFILKTNSDDFDYEEERSQALVERILGRNNVINYRYVGDVDAESAEALRIEML